MIFKILRNLGGSQLG